MPKNTATKNKTSALKNQISGTHYGHGKVQPVVFLEGSPHMTFCQQQIIKYASRLQLKGKNKVEIIRITKEDLNKIRHYCDLYEELNGLKE